MLPMNIFKDTLVEYQNEKGTIRWLLVRHPIVTIKII